MFRYKGYVGSAEPCFTGIELHGKLLGIKDLIMYHGNTMTELGEAFQEAVDHYLNICSGFGKEPNKTDYVSIGVEDPNQDFKDFCSKFGEKNENNN